MVITKKKFLSALKKVQNTKKPTIISCKTKIGYGSPNKSGKASSHGSPIGTDEIKLVRRALNWKYKPFEIPKNILNEWRKIGIKGCKTSVYLGVKFIKEKNKIVDKVFKNNFSKAIEV